MFMDSNLLEFEQRFEKILSEFEENKEISESVEVMSDHKLYAFYMSKVKKLESVATKIKTYNKLKQDIVTLDELLKESGDLSVLSEKEALVAEKEKIFEDIQKDLVGQKEKQEETIIVEICSKEDFEFAETIKNLIEDYVKSSFAELEVIEQPAGSFKLKVSGEGIFEKLILLSGKVKKILRGEQTNASVVVIKQLDSQIEINEDDLIIQTSKSSGAGGQHINKTESAIKIIHKPTGIFAECQDERSQTKNKEKALKFLSEKIAQINAENIKKNDKKQRNNVKNKLFSSTASVVFDYDANKILLNENKTEYKLKDILDNGLEKIFNNSIK